MKRHISRSVVRMIAALAVLFAPAFASAAELPSAKMERRRDAAATPRFEAAAKQLMESPTIRQGFPKVKLGSNCEVIGPATDGYNCIAWSAGITDRWVWPGDTVARFDEFYAQRGFRRLDDLDYGVQPGVEKIVLYAKPTADGSRIVATHAARQDVSGGWTSKLGQCPLIHHDTLEDLAGPAYGAPIAVYVRVGAN